MRVSTQVGAACAKASRTVAATAGASSPWTGAVSATRAHRVAPSLLAITPRIARRAGRAPTRAVVARCASHRAGTSTPRSSRAVRCPVVAAAEDQRSPSRKHHSTVTEVPSMGSSNVTRRKLLKRAGVGAAAVGAGAMVTASSAQAVSSTICIDAGGCIDCPAANYPCHGDCCYCFMSTEGCCFCAEDFFCNGVEACHTSSDCPPGWGCVYSCCGGGTACAPPCGTFVPGVNFCHPSHGQAQGTGASGAGQSSKAAGHHAEPEAPAPPAHGHGHG
jgi:hypothetical protein